MTKCAACLVLLVLTAAAAAVSINLDSPVAEDIALLDAGGNAIPAGAVDVFQDAGGIYILNWRATATDQYWQETAHELTLHNADGSFVSTLAADTTTGYKSFVCKHGPAVYYGLGDEIYSVDYAAPGAPVVAATLGNNYDMRFDTDGTAFAVANPGWTGNSIYKVDLTGGNDHVKVVEGAGVYSAELAFDADDNLYYGTYGSATDELRTFTEAQLDAVTGTPLAMSDGAWVTDLAYGAGGLAIDEAGNVLFTVNSFAPAYSALCAVWAGKDYSGYGPHGYDVLTEASFWTASADALGDVFAYSGGAGDAAFVTGGATLTAVPEPVALALWAAGGAALLWRRRRAGRTRPRRG